MDLKVKRYVYYYVVMEANGIDELNEKGRTIYDKFLNNLRPSKNPMREAYQHGIEFRQEIQEEQTLWG
jgi:hypothetical protein